MPNGKPNIIVIWGDADVITNLSGYCSLLSLSEVCLSTLIFIYNCRVTFTLLFYLQL